MSLRMQKINKREGYKQILSDLATRRIQEKQCPSCGRHKTEWARRTDWRCCSVECTKNFWNEHVKVASWQDLRIKCFARDDWRCVNCGKQPTTILQNEYVSQYQKVLKVEYIDKYKCNMATVVDTLIADHKQAIALGGKEWDINNLQTLCKECNKNKTAIDARKIARRRDILKKQSGGQTILGSIYCST